MPRGLPCPHFTAFRGSWWRARALIRSDPASWCAPGPRQGAGNEEFATDIARTVPVIRVDWAAFRDVDEMAGAIEREYLAGSFLREVSWGLR